MLAKEGEHREGICLSGQPEGLIGEDLKKSFQCRDEYVNLVTTDVWEII